MDQGVIYIGYRAGGLYANPADKLSHTVSIP